ncbi:hypothetical protein DRQ25_17855 [Candidatus Fermentibacteria bacterium]|nr:MAG: hypothetical protein DRQ25_17855 [Candidatus Fermentibacteria bacterium]
MYDGTDLIFYFDGVNTNNDTQVINTGDGYLNFGQSIDISGGNLGDGFVSQYLLYDRAITQDDVSALYNSGAGCDKNAILADTCAGVPAGLPYTHVLITDLYNNATLPDGTTCYLGEVSNTSVSGVCSFYNQTTGLNYSVGSTNYFTATGTAVENSTINTQLLGAFPNVTAYNVEAVAVTTFNLTTAFTSNTTGAGSARLLLPPNASTSVNVTALNYFLLVANITTGSQDLDDKNVSGLYQTTFTINATNKYTGTLLSNFTGYAYHNDTGYNYTFNTTGNTTSFNALLGNYSVYVDVAGYSIGSDNTQSVLVDNTTKNLTFSLYSENSIFINIYDEETSIKILDNVSVIVSGNSSEETYYTTSGGLFVDNLTDGSYSIKFNSANYTQRTYIVSVADRSTQTLNAYLSASTDNVVLSIVDYDTATSLEGASIQQQRIVNGSWVNVESKLSDITGRAQFSFTIGTKYRFVVSYTGYTTKYFELDPIIFTSYYIRLEQIQTITEDYSRVDVTIYNTPQQFVNEQGNNFTLTFGSATGTLESYGYTLTFPGGSSAGAGVSANGETFAYTANITGASFGDRVNLTYWYDSIFNDNTTYTQLYLIDGAPQNGTAAKLKTDSYGMGAVEKGLLAMFIVLLVAFAFAVFGVPLIGVVAGLFLQAYFTYIGYLNIWFVVPSILIGLLVIVGSKK